MYGQEAMSLRTMKNWLKLFKDENFDIADIIIPDTPVDFDEERMHQLIHEDQCQTSRKLAEIMECSHSIIMHPFHSIGKVQKLGAWVPHALNDNSENQLFTTSPLAIWFHAGDCNCQVLINIILFLCFVFPAIIHAIWYCFCRG